MNFTIDKISEDFSKISFDKATSFDYLPGEVFRLIDIARFRDLITID